MNRGTWLTGTLVAAWLVGGGAHAAVGGAYASPVGGLDIKVKGKTVTATAVGGGACGWKKGQSVLKGQVIDDSVTGKLSVCTEGAGCGTEDAFVVLLIARKGDLLSGAVQLKNKACTLPGGAKGLKLSRAGGAKPAKAAPAKPDKKKDPPAKASPAGGETTPAAGSSSGNTAEAPAAASPDGDAATPFAEWTPGDVAAASEGRGGGGGRKVAIQRAREAEKLLGAGQFEAARPALMDALKADPGYAEGYNMMGVTYYARDRYDDALDWYKKALTVNPDFGDAYYNMACIYTMEGKKPLALKYLRIALLNGYSQRDAMEKDPDLDGLRNDAEYKELLKLLDARPAAGAPEAAPPAEAAPAPDAGAAPAATP